LFGLVFCRHSKFADTRTRSLPSWISVGLLGTFINRPPSRIAVNVDNVRSDSPLYEYSLLPSHEQIGFNSRLPLPYFARSRNDFLNAFRIVLVRWSHPLLGKIFVFLCFPYMGRQRFIPPHAFNGLLSCLKNFFGSLA